jgi:hypothetical protein
MAHTRWQGWPSSDWTLSGGAGGGAGDWLWLAGADISTVAAGVVAGAG